MIAALRLDLQVVGGRGVGEALDEAGSGFLDAGPDAAEEGLLEDGRGEDPVRDGFLQLVELYLALLTVQLLRLAEVQILELGGDPVRVDSGPRHEGLEPGRRISRRGPNA